jgi:hypothetical protein
MSFRNENSIKIIKRALEQPKPIGDNNILGMLTTPTEMLQANMLVEGRILCSIVCWQLVQKRYMGHHLLQPYSCHGNVIWMQHLQEGKRKVTTVL